MELKIRSRLQGGDVVICKYQLASVSECTLSCRIACLVPGAARRAATTSCRPDLYVSVIMQLEAVCTCQGGQTIVTNTRLVCRKHRAGRAWLLDGWKCCTRHNCVAERGLSDSVPTGTNPLTTHAGSFAQLSEAAFERASQHNTTVTMSGYEGELRVQHAYSNSDSDSG